MNTLAKKLFFVQPFIFPFKYLHHVEKYRLNNDNNSFISPRKITVCFYALYNLKLQVL